MKKISDLITENKPSKVKHDDQTQSTQESNDSLLTSNSLDKPESNAAVETQVFNIDSTETKLLEIH